MTTRSFIIGWALIVLLVGACSVQADYIYDFNHLTAGQPLVGQDGWANNEWGRSLQVASVTGADGYASNVAHAAGGSPSYAGNYRSWATPLTFTSADTVVTQGFQFYLCSSNDYQIVGVGATFTGAGNPIDGYEMTFGMRDDNGSKFYFQKFNKTTYDSDPVADDHWYDVKLVMNFSADTASLFYRDLTLSQTAWTAAAGIQNKPMGISGGSPFTVDGFQVCGWGGTGSGTYVDNYYIIPEPGTLALLATGLIGLLCYAWRKRK